MNFLALLRAEWTKTMRMRTTYIAFVVIGLFVTLCQVALYRRGLKSIPGGDMFVDWSLDTGLILNGYMTTVFITMVAFSLLIAPMIILTFARQVAGEDLRGTLRTLLCRPVSRFAVLNAKLLVCAAYVLLLMGFHIGLSYGMGLAFYGSGPSLTIRSGHQLRRMAPEREAARQERDEAVLAAEEAGEEPPDSGRRGLRQFSKSATALRATPVGAMLRAGLVQRINEMTITPTQIHLRLAALWGLCSFALLTLGSIALFYSTLNKHPIAAMSFTLGTFFMVMIIQFAASSDENVFTLFKGVEPYLFTRAMDVYRESLGMEIDFPKIRKELALLGAHTIFFHALALWNFHRKDITS